MPGPAAAAVGLVLHGRLGSWLQSASELQIDEDIIRRNASAKQLPQASKLRAVRAYAAFTHASFERHLIGPSRATGADVRVVVHSWNPECADVLDRLYRPAASAHEQTISGFDKVESQHESMRRGLAMLRGLKASPVALVMVARLDLLLYSDVPLPRLVPPAGQAASARRLYLPHTCIPSRMRLPVAAATSEVKVLRRTCSGSELRGNPAGQRMLPTQLTRYHSYKVRDQPHTRAHGASHLAPLAGQRAA